MWWDLFEKKNRNYPQKSQNGYWIQYSPTQVPFRAICVNVEKNKEWWTGHFKAIYILMRIFYPFFGPFLFCFSPKDPTRWFKNLSFGKKDTKTMTKKLNSTWTFFWNLGPPERQWFLIYSSLQVFPMFPRQCMWTSVSSVPNCPAESTTLRFFLNWKIRYLNWIFTWVN